MTVDVKYSRVPNSEVKVYDPSVDSTIPSTSKKRKFEEVEQEEAAEEAEATVAKSKKPKKERVKEGGWNQSGGFRFVYIYRCQFCILVLNVFLLHFLQRRKQ